VAGVADASSGVAKYAVTVSFNDTTGAFNAGASVSVAVTYAQTGDTLSVPFRAVSTTNGTSTVEVSSGSGTETRTVTTGITANAMVQITSGLSADEQVVVRAPGQNRTQGTGTQTPGGQTTGGPGGTGTNTRAGS
jgi:macrolide-specific efflux system membrane fusion protein